MILVLLLILITIVVVWFLLERYRARRLEATARHSHEETFEKHVDSSDIPYYYYQALKESRMQHDKSLLVTGEIPRATCTLQQKTADTPSFRYSKSHSSCCSKSHSSCSSQLLRDTCSVFTQCVQASDTRLEDELVIGLQPGIQLIRIEETIPPDETTIALDTKVPD